MAQLEANGRYNETSNTPKGQQSPTFQQLLQGEAAWQFSPSPTFARSHEEEDFSSGGNKKSMLTRVKERAKKLRQSFSVKRKHDVEVLDGHTTPSWGVSLEDNDDDEVDEDPEYLGAPMYESELAPETLKESARQHPRANPVVSENHMWPTGIKHVDEDKDKHEIHNKTITEAMSDKLAPAYAAVSDATQTIASKIPGMTVSVSEEQPKHTIPNTEHPTADGMESLDRCSEIGDHITTKSPQKWDKGVSVKEYFMNKLEPGEDDKALSQVISEAISPKKGSTDVGVVEKVREAVTSFLRHEVPSQLSQNGSPAQPSRETIKATNLSSNNPSSTNNKVSSPNSTSSTKGTSLSDIHISSRTSSVEEPSKRAIKIASLSASTPISSKTEARSPKSVTSTTVNIPYIPISYSSSPLDEPSRQKVKAKNLSSNNQVCTETKGKTPNSISSSKIHSSSGTPVSHTTSSVGAHSKETIKVAKSSSNTPISTKKEVPLPNYIFSTNANRSSNMPIARSKSLSSHIPVPNNANSSPLIPISTNAKEGQFPQHRMKFYLDVSSCR